MSGSATDWIWAAGFLDGEGCFMVQRQRRHPGGVSHAPVVVVTNTNRAILEHLRELLGGIIALKRPAGGNWNAVYDLHIRGSKKVLAALPPLIPFLRVKGPEAKLLVELAERVRSSPARLSAEERDAREAIAAAVDRLKTRGGPRPLGRGLPE